MNDTAVAKRIKRLAGIANEARKVSREVEHDTPETPVASDELRKWIVGLAGLVEELADEMRRENEA